MKWGLRLQLLLLLGALMLLTYVPLFYASSTYTRLGFEQLQRENAVKLGRSVATHLVELRKKSSEAEILTATRAQIERSSVHVLALLPPEGPPVAVLGDPDLIRSISKQTGFKDQAEARELITEEGPALLIFEPGEKGGVAAIVRVDPVATRAQALNELMGLYMAVGGLALLVAAYFALTRWIVRPILHLEHQAERIAAGARRMAPLKKAPRELSNLSHRLSEMTSQLLEEEESLKRKIDEVQARTEELRLAQATVVRSERLATVGRLAAGLAHEVGNPISALMGLQDLMIDGGLSPEENADFLQRMKKETERIDRVLSDLLAYARAPKTESAPHPDLVPGSVADTITAVFDLLRPQRDLQNISLQEKVDAQLPPVALSQEELTQVLLNLIMNAVDACEGEGLVQLEASVSGEQQVKIVVQDSGHGIPEEVRDSLFEPFVSTKEVGRGTGLGLSVTKGLIEAAGGQIHVESPEGSGARFILLLPASQRSL